MPDKTTIVGLKFSIKRLNQFIMSTKIEANGVDKKENLKIFSGSANPELAKEISECLKMPLGKILTRKFPDGETKIEVNENVREKDVYIIQPTCPPNVNDNLIELILMISTMRRSSSRRITAVIPYYGYSRQDRKFRSRVPIAAADVARLLEAMGVDRVVVVDLHCFQIQGFFGPNTPCDNLNGSFVAIEYFLNLGLDSKNTSIVSPDAGGVYRAKMFRDHLTNKGFDAGFAIIIKQRSSDDKIDSLDIIGDVKGKNLIIVDDMIDTASTLTKAGEELKRFGAKRIFAFATHGLFSGNAIENLKKSQFEKIVITNTVPLSEEKKIDKIVQVSIAPYIAMAIKRIYERKSLSELFEF